MKQIPVEQLFAKSTQGTWECGGQYHHAIGIGPNALLGSFANPNDSIVATHCTNHFRELLDALREAVKEGQQLNKHFYRDSEWDWIARANKAIDSASTVEMEG